MEFIRKLGYPITWIYGLVVRVRNYLYDKGCFVSRTFNVPTVCVGNLSVGGTGKTPMVEFLISQLSTNLKIAVLSRGYGRKSKGWLLAGPETTVEDLGDEPYQIYSKFPHIPVAVDADRCNGIERLQQEVSPDLILLDDAFQHRKVVPDLSVLLTAYGNLYPDDEYLPVGRLRDSRKEADRADIIVVTKCPPNLVAGERSKIFKKLSPIAGQDLLFSTLVYDGELKGDRDSLPLAKLKGRSVTVVTGIADPEPLLLYLEQNGITVNHLGYGDHHFFTEKEIARFNAEDRILTTEKDYVRLQGRVKNLYYLGIRHQFLDDGKEILLGRLEGELKNAHR